MNHREAIGTMNMSMTDGTTPLMTAVKLAVEEMVEQLLAYQVEVNATDNRGLCYVNAFPIIRTFRIKYCSEFFGGQAHSVKSVVVAAD